MFLTEHTFQIALAYRSDFELYIVPLKNIINEVYSKDISRKLLPVFAAKQRNGEFIGNWAI